LTDSSWDESSPLNPIWLDSRRGAAQAPYPPPGYYPPPCYAVTPGPMGGAARGAAGGAIIGAIGGNAGRGVAIGATVGGELPVPSAAAPHAPKELATDGSHTADMEKGSDS
jgi:hypothetical protein